MLRKKFILFSAAALVLTFSFSSLAFADDIEVSSEKIENIEMDCSSIKQTLKRIQNIDKNTRISLGRSYQTILSNFITPLNVRIVKNNQTNSELTSIQTQYVEAREAFNHEYIIYSQEFEGLLNIDCKNEPEQFYAQLIATRESRKKVADLTVKIREVLKKHEVEVEKFKNTFEVKDER